MLDEGKRRFVENTFVYDPEYFELKQKYEELCKVVLDWEDADTYADGQYLHSHMIKLAKGETN